MLNTVVPNVDAATATDALHQAEGWVKLAALICMGTSRVQGLKLLDDCDGSLRAAMRELGV